MASRYDIAAKRGIWCGELKGIKEARLLPPDSNGLLRQIELRMELINQMVGTLYPSIVMDEVLELQERYTGREWKKVIFYA